MSCRGWPQGCHISLGISWGTKKSQWPRSNCCPLGQTHCWGRTGSCWLQVALGRIPSVQRFRKQLAQELPSELWVPCSPSLHQGPLSVAGFCVWQPCPRSSAHTHMRLGTCLLSQAGVVLFQAKSGEAQRRECQNTGGVFSFSFFLFRL